VIVFYENMKLIDESLNDPLVFDCDSFEGQGLDSVKVDPLPPSLVQDERCVVDEGYLSACYKFMILMLSMPSLSVVERDIDAEVKIDFCKGGPSDGARPTMIVYMSRAL